MNKIGRRKGQLELSFSMIFSIIIIIAIIGVAFYVITYFLNLSRCTDVGFFYSDLQKRTDKAWASEITQETFTGKLPSNIKEVCFGSLNQTNVISYKSEYEFLRRYLNLNKNIYMYPPANACDINLAYYDLNHAQMPEFFCLPVKDGTLNIKLTKTSFDALVKITK